MKKHYKSSIIKNHKITKTKFFFDGVPLKGYVASGVIFDLAPEIKKRIVGISSDLSDA